MRRVPRGSACPVIAAGIDIGNTTTEVVVVDVARSVMAPLGRARSATVGLKGSAESVEAAARLLRRVEDQHHLRCAHALIAELHPVLTQVAALPARSPRPSALQRVDSRSAATPFGDGLAVGVHVPLSALLEGGTALDLIVSVPSATDFEVAAETINGALSRGHVIRGVLAEGDDAVLIGNRLDRRLPIVDEIPVGELAVGVQILLEVAPPGASLRTLCDPIALAALLERAILTKSELVEAARGLVDARSAVLTVGTVRPRSSDAGVYWVEYLDSATGDLNRLPLTAAGTELAEKVLPGSVRRVRLPSSDSSCRAELTPARDLFIPDFAAMAGRSSIHVGQPGFAETPLAVLAPGDAQTGAAADTLRGLLGRPVSTPCSEASAACRGAATTPGAPVGATVCDLGGGTIDLVRDDASVTAAGGGELVTRSVASCLGISRSLAERVKKYKSVRVETPHLVHHENGERSFLPQPAAPDSIGRLCFMARGRPVPFADDLSPEEWRLLRLSLKREVLGGNIERCLRALDRPVDALLLCGGPAGDDETLRIVDDRLAGSGAVVGRADVAGSLGTRYAVALGLVMAFWESAEVHKAG